MNINLEDYESPESADLCGSAGGMSPLESVFVHQFFSCPPHTCTGHRLWRRADDDRAVERSCDVSGVDRSRNFVALARLAFGCELRATQAWTTKRQHGRFSGVDSMRIVWQ
jgi:hypothetical protein